MSLLGELLGITPRWVKRENLRPDALPLAMDEFLTPQRSQPAAAKPSATLATGAKRVRVPDDLEAISADDLRGLVQKLCAERTAMERAASGSSWSSSMAPPPSAARPGKATAAQSTPAPPLAAPKATELAAMKKRLADKSAKAIKKTKHNDKRKPYTEVNEGMPNKATALALLEGLAPSCGHGAGSARAVSVRRRGYHRCSGRGRHGFCSRGRSDRKAPPQRTHRARMQILLDVMTVVKERRFVKPRLYFVFYGLS